MPELLCICVSREEDTIKIGEIIGKLATPGSIFALKGELGAGKTVLVKGIARGLGVKEEPNSPTFVIMNAYHGRLPLYHFDLYRITSIEELEEIGYEEFFFGKGVSVVEWADRIEELFPDNTIKVEIQIPEGEDTKSGRRKLKIEGDKKWLSSFKNMVGQALQT
ncbi:tRNA threonylcarbamoyladenosine biosynthesis protein TsaE [bacterium HR37]|jgi:tRNA threonylcarbamoyladenosine biosynthesis protein TsaE|nr:tRNA threonylcarbamoyladenosine biosynthesis protein TsaE [bacterium HR37]